MKTFPTLACLTLLALSLSACKTTQPPPVNVAYWRAQERVILEQNNETGFKVEVHYPELISGPNAEPAAVENKKIQGFITQVIQNFKAKIPRDNDALQDYPKEMRHNELTVTYLSYLAPVKETIYLSLRFQIKTLFYAQDIPKYQYAVLNDNLSLMQPLLLSSLFRKDSDYLQRLSSYCTKRIATKLDINMPWMPNDTNGTTAREENFTVWNLRQDGILITFQESQLEPYSPTSQKILVPYAVLNPVLAPGSGFARNGIEVGY